MQQEAPATRLESPPAAKQIRHLRQILLWPVQLLPLQEGGTAAAPLGAPRQARSRQSLARARRRVRRSRRVPGAALQRVRHLPAAGAALPLWPGRGPRRRSAYGESPIRVLRRTDIATVRVTLVARRRAASSCSIIACRSLLLLRHRHRHPGPGGRRRRPAAGVAQEALFRFGRAYPAYWEEDARGGHCPWLVEWLSPEGRGARPLRLREAREISGVRVPASGAGAWRRIGSSCFRRWCCITATGAGRCATASSNTTACPTWRSSPWRTCTR